MTFNRLVAMIAIASATLVTGCASVPMASLEQDTAAKTFATSADKANIYVYRNETFGAAVKMPIAIDGRLVGDTTAKTFIKLEVAPGEHTIVSKTENDPQLKLTAAAGKNYFVWQEVKMGMWAAGSALHEVDEAAGKTAVADCKLIEPVK